MFSDSVDDMKRENEAESMFLAITTFQCCHSIFLKWKSRESISHVSLGGPGHVPKHFRIRPDVHILDWASRTVTEIPKASRFLLLKLLSSVATTAILLFSSLISNVVQIVRKQTPFENLNDFKEENFNDSLNTIHLCIYCSSALSSWRLKCEDFISLTNSELLVGFYCFVIVGGINKWSS